LADTAIADNDLFRNWIKNMFNEDTSYYKTRANLKVDNLYKYFTDDRISRWQFALQIFSKEFSIKQKIFGGGFSFLNWYGFYYLKDKTQSDWPHNPFLSILLYSGIIGLLIYCFFLYKVFYYYLKYRKEYLILFIFFSITFFFSFFSGDSPFDPPILGFFVILPFFIHSIHKKEDQNNIQLSDHESTIK
jgi:O-antigen ligase